MLELAPYFEQYGQDLVTASDSTVKLWSQYLLNKSFYSTHKARAALYQWTDWTTTDNLLLRTQGVKNVNYMTMALIERGCKNISNLSDQEETSLLKNLIKFTVQLLQKVEATSDGASLPNTTDAVLTVFPPEKIASMAGVFVLSSALNIQNYRD